MPSYYREVKIDGKPAQELFDFISGDIERFLNKAAMGNFEVKRDAAARCIEIKSAMFNAKLKCEDSKVVLDGSLSLLASAFKGKIDSGIEHWLSKHFPGSKLT
ncbi:MAG: polyhydroxyalkanoic acid system family protein [Bdellovibrionales bacterium]|nr:polyhydroxyalkanoic acid system family protein [Bdellovibrionales bacterium]